MDTTVKDARSAGHGQGAQMTAAYLKLARLVEHKNLPLEVLSLAAEIESELEKENAELRRLVEKLGTDWNALIGAFEKDNKP